MNLKKIQQKMNERMAKNKKRGPGIHIEPKSGEFPLPEIKYYGIASKRPKYRAKKGEV